MGAATKTFCFGVGAILVAYLYLKWRPQEPANDDGQNTVEKRVVDAWEKTIKYPQKPFSRLAVGFNGNIDLIVSGVDLLEKMNIKPGKEHNHKLLTSLEDMQEAFTHFFSKGSAAERVFKNPEIYKEVVKTVYTLDKLEQHIGGNAALMADLAAILFPGVQIQFVGPVGPVLKKLMPESIYIPPDSIIERDEFHLIMEYKRGQTWGSATAPVANRFICSYDLFNSEMSMLETYFDTLDDFKPDLVLVSGLHLVDFHQPEFFLPRLDALAKGLNTVDPRLPVHLEFASMVNPLAMKGIMDKALHKVTSIGLNEQELGFTSISANGPHSEYLKTREGQPLIHVMSDLVRWLLTTYGKSAIRPDSRLTRVHFHSLTYHITGVHKSHWKNVKSATMAGTRVAGLQACDTKTLSPDLVDLRIPLKFKLHSEDILRTFDPENPVYTWSFGEHYFVFSPVLVCKQPVKTVGLGDAISTTGLMFSEFVP